MCGRYVTPSQAAIEREWQLRASDATRFLDQIFDNPDASPTQHVPMLRVIRHLGGKRELVEARWSLIPEWAHGEPPKTKQTGRPLSTFNATIENFRTSGAFSGAWKNGKRCLIPVRGFYEWQAQPPDWQRTVRYYITLNDQDIFCFAGLWDQSKKPDGEIIDSVTIITMPANELMKTIHNSRKRGSKRELLPEDQRRMPAILRKEDQETWLTGTPQEAWEALKPYPSEFMVAWPVDGPVDLEKVGTSR